MNHIHRKIWSVRLGAFVAVGETARGRGKQPGATVSGAVLVLGLWAAGPALAQSPPPGTLPSGARVSAGAAAIAQSGLAMTVTQGTQRAAINWQDFSIGKDASVNFVQPSTGAVLLNRVTGAEKSVIDGALRANGQVFLLNPNGVLFNASARVDTAGLVASTRDLSDADFLAGRTTFSGSGTGTVVNAGQISASDGGYVALIGQQVRNDGLIAARLGTVALAAGDRVSLNFDGSALVGVTVEQGTLDALVRNGGAVLADGGTVLLKATAAEALLETVVNNTGQIRAQSVAERNGKIILLGEGGTVEVAGSLDASNPGQGNGGFIETSGPQVNVKDGVRVTAAAAHGEAGTWLIDPVDFTISAGNAAQTLSGIGAGMLELALQSADVMIQTTTGPGNGDIHVNAPVTWNSNKLTLEAHGDIKVNAVMTATGLSRLDLKTGYNFNTSAPTFDLSKTVRTKWELDSNGNPVFVGRIDFDRTGTGVLSINNRSYILINALGAAGSTTGTDLQGINGNLGGAYALASNIDATASAGFGNWGSGFGFKPIGEGSAFTGVLEGLGHVVFNYAQLSTNANVGLIGQVNSANAMVRNIGVTNLYSSANGVGRSGGLVGWLNAGTVSNVFATGLLDAFVPQAGGLIGQMSAGTTLSNSYANVDVSFAFADAGGLVGHAGANATIRNSSAAGYVSASGNNVGGLLGTSAGATVIGSSASGSVSGANNVGGLVGLMDGVSLVSDGHATGSVSGTMAVGGLVGGIASSGSTATQILNSDASGNVTAVASAAGGLVGKADGSAASVATQISNSHAAGGTVTSQALAGGLVGELLSVNISDAYADMRVVGSQSSGQRFGGLVGGAQDMALLRSYAMGDVDVSVGSGQLVGGLVGEAVSASLTDVYARGDVIAPAGSAVGGLAGALTATTVQRTYATGQVTGATNTGGLIGQASGASVTNSFWDVQTSGWGTAGSTTGSAGGTGRSSADMHSSALYADAGWNLALGNGTWGRRDDLNDQYPVLRAFGYTDRIATLLIDPSWLAGTGAMPLSYTTTGLLSGDTLALSQSNGQLVFSHHLATGAGNYDALQVTARNTSGDLTINRALAWNDFQLNLEAAGHLNINAVLSATGTAQLDMKSGYNFNPLAPAFLSPYRVNMGMDAGHGFSGRVDIDRAGTGILAINGQAYTLVNQLGNAGDEQLANGTLQGMALSGNYALASHIDAAATAGWNGGAGFTPIGAGSTPFTGRFEGLGHSISGLSIQQSAPRDVSNFQVGLFGRVDNASFSNLALTGVNITGPGQTGALFGATVNNPSRVANITVSGTVAGSNASGGTGADVGGLVGAIANAGTTLVNTHSTATVTGSADNIGGLVGASNGSTVSDSSATGTVTGRNAVGGLVGKGAVGSTVTGSWATGAVTGQNGVGGLVGVLDSQSGANSIGTSYATGRVLGHEMVGGLVGDSPYFGTVIQGSYASGNVQARRFTGGFIGSGNASITDAYATGNVTASDPSVAFAGGFSGGGAGTIVLDRVYASGTVTAADLGNSFGSGGLSGFGFYTVINSFYDATRNPNGGAVGLGQGKTTAQMQNAATFQAAGWDFTFLSGTWGRKDSANNGAPVLRSFGFTDAILVNLGVGGKVYGDANPALTGATFLGCPTANCAGLITGVDWGTALDATTNAGSYALSAPGLLSYSFGGGASAALFEFNYVQPAFTIAPRSVSLAAVGGATRVYDGTADAAASLFTLGNLVNGDTVALTGSAVLDSTHAGSRGVASSGTLALGNANYQLAGSVPTGNVAITPRELSLAVVGGASRVYDGTADAATGLFAVGNVVGSDQVGLTGQAVLDGANAGTRAVAGLGTLAVANSDYVLASGTPAGSVAITPRTVSVAAATGATRVYDGTAAAAADLFALGNLVAGDQVLLSGQAVLDSTHAGSRGVSSAGTLALDNANYQLAGGAPTGNVAITPRQLSLAVAGGAGRVYDGTADAAAALFAVGNVVGSDQVGLTGQAVLDSANVGTRAVAGLGSLAVANSDYVLAAGTPAGSVAITPKALQLNVVAGATRVFDGTADAAASLFDVSGLLGTDTAALSGNAVLGSAAVGSQQVAAFGTLALGNTNYQLDAGLPTGSVAITPASVPGPVADLDRAASVIASAQRTLVLPDPQLLVSAPQADTAPVAAAANVVNTPPALSTAFGPASPLLLLSAPAAEEPTEGVTLQQARRMVGTSADTAATASPQDVRVPVNRNALAEVVNGGVRLPGGVDQLLFVVKAPK